MSIDSSITADTEQPAIEEPPEKQTYSHHGLDVYSYDGVDYAVADTDDQADEAASQAAMSSLWAFRARFIARHSPVDLNDEHVKAIEEMQCKMCESCGPIIQAIVGKNLDALIDDAIESDGRGSLLGSYDHDEHDGEDIHPSWKDKIVYRI
jgi:hypothetical protein